MGEETPREILRTRFGALLLKLKEKPNDVELLIQAGNTLEELGNMDQSKPYFQRALQIDPSRISLIYKLGGVCPAPSTAPPPAVPEVPTIVPPAAVALETPFLTYVARLFAGLEVLGGFILCEKFWPKYDSNEIAYMPSITWLVAGFISAFLFLAIGEVLAYLNILKHHVCRLTGD